MTKSDIARDFLTRHPKVKQNRTLAKMLLKEQPKTFKDIEDARSFIRRVLGKTGVSNKDELGSKGDFIEQIDNIRKDEDNRLSDQIKHLIQHKKKAAYSVEELSDMFDCGVGKVRAVIEELEADGYTINLKNGHAIMSNVIEKGDDIYLDIKQMSTGFHRFGAIGDNHLCSRYQRLDVLNAIYDQYERDGIKVVFNTGNWIDGEARFNVNDLLEHGMDNQIKYFLEHYPSRKNIITYFISGDDHEGWYTQKFGIDVGKHMAAMAKEMGREDIVYLGHMEHDVVIKAKHGETKIRVLHAGGGSSYAISYAAQKIIESYQGGEKPDILLIGHYHKAAYNFVRGVHIIQTATTEDQTPFMRKNKLAAHLGAWEFEFATDDVGAITRFKQEFFPFYDNKYYEKWRYLWK